MKQIIELIELEIAKAFEQAGYGKELAKVTISNRPDLCEYQCNGCMKAAKEYHIKKVALAGGVASNSALRGALEEACSRRNIQFYRPSPLLCTDNAAMIGAAGYYDYMNGKRAGLDLNAVPNLKIGEKA